MRLCAHLKLTRDRVDDKAQSDETEIDFAECTKGARGQESGAYRAAAKQVERTQPRKSARKQ